MRKSTRDTLLLAVTIACLSVLLLWAAAKGWIG